MHSLSVFVKSCGHFSFLLLLLLLCVNIVMPQEQHCPSSFVVSSSLMLLFQQIIIWCRVSRCSMSYWVSVMLTADRATMSISARYCKIKKMKHTPHIHLVFAKFNMTAPFTLFITCVLQQTGLFLCFPSVVFSWRSCCFASCGPAARYSFHTRDPHALL